MRHWLAAGLIVAGLLAACGGSRPPSVSSAAAGGAAADAEKIVNVYNWSDYIAPDIIPGFEREYGIQVNYDVFDSNELLETKLLAGHSGYDVVVPSAPFLQRQIQAGVFQKLDKALLPNLHNMDPQVLQRIQVYDPGNQYGVNYFWGTSGIGYNQDLIRQAMPDAPVDSLAMLYDPAVVQKFTTCGVSILDAPDEVVGTVLIYLGRNPNSESLQDLQAAERVLLAIRPYVHEINSSRYIEELVNGDICLALGWSGDVAQARVRAREAGRSVNIQYRIPREGAITFYDMLAIPADAPHPNNAHLFINYLMRADVAAKNASVEHYASGNAAAYPLIDTAVYSDRGIYPAESVKPHLYPSATHSLAYTRELNRVWTRFKTGQ